MRQVFVYGPQRGQSSWPRVTRGACAGLAAHGALAGSFDIEAVDRWEDQALPEGMDAEVAVCIGPPAAASVMQARGFHKERLLMLAVNSTWIPHEQLKRYLDRKLITGFVTPSRWSKGIIERYGLGPVYLWRHGVSEDFKPLADVEPSDHLRVLHLSSTCRDRKGTAALISGWMMALREGMPHTSRLHIVSSLPENAQLRAMSAAWGDEKCLATIRYSLPLMLPELQMSAYYQQFDYVCQPSRAEGYGLTPIEARASGVPTIATFWTGHAEHMGRLAPDGEVKESLSSVAVGGYGGEDLPIDDGPGALAPMVEVVSVGFALIGRHLSCEFARANALAEAPKLNWGWSHVTKLFLDELG